MYGVKPLPRQYPDQEPLQVHPCTLSGFIPEADAPDQDTCRDTGMLGMSFLRELDFSQQGNTLTLNYPERGVR